MAVRMTARLRMGTLVQMRSTVSDAGSISGR